MWNILQEEGAAELLEEGPIIYMSSYYVSHETCLEQRADRPLRLTRDYERWHEVIREVWQDHFDELSPFEVFLALPEPPISVTRGISGILLVVQHPVRGKAAALVTSVTDAFPDPPHYQEAAFSLDTQMEQIDIIRCAGVFDLCEEARRRGL